MEEAAWDRVRLVVFDVDGTLYRQRTLRLRMARDLVLARSLEAIRIVGAYRRQRERAAGAYSEDALVAAVASATGAAVDQVRATLAEWLERRPLPYLAQCRYPHVPALFDGLRGAGVRVGVWSDHPVTAKLAALGLTADHAISAAEVGALKPDPRGLLALVDAAGVTPAQTVMIGDRPERDGEAALRAGVPALIRSARPRPGWDGFARYDDPLFRRFTGGR